MSFKEDLAFGQVAEDEIALYFKSLGFMVVQSKGYDKGKDMQVNANFEIKHDRLAPKTGNYAIEMKCRGKLSGLVTTTAHAWILKTDEGAWLCKVDELRKWAAFYCKDEDGTWKLTKGGDDNASEFALIPYSAVKTFKRLY